jgi:FMN reductase
MTGFVIRVKRKSKCANAHRLSSHACCAILPVILMDFEKRVRVTGLCGSRREGSYTKMALTIALRAAEGPGCETDLIDLRELDLVFADGTMDRQVTAPGVQRLRDRLGSADGVIIGTPEYHGSFTGVLKNALDLTGFAEWEGKMIALIGVSGGRMGAHNALNSLREIGRSLHAWVIPDQVSIPEAYKYFDTTGNLKNQALEKRLHELGRQVARFTYLHKCAAAHDFLSDWEKAQPNPGAAGRPVSGR